MEMVEIYTLSKRGKKLKVEKETYDVIHAMILSVLSREQEVSLSRLIEVGETQLATTLLTNIAWLIVQIKNDMVLREHIEVRIDQDRSQLIRLRKRKKTRKFGVWRLK
jgi:hypothetical protein